MATNTLLVKLLDNLFEIQGYSLVDIERKTDRINLFLKNEELPRCPYCGREHSSGRYDSKERTFYLGSLNTTPIYGILRIYRFKCSKCGIVTEAQRISENKKSYSKSIGEVVTNYTRYLDNVSTSKLLGLTESMVFRIDKDELSRKMEHYIKRVPDNIKSIGVDEVSRKRRHTYATVVTNQDDSKVIWLEKGRSKDSLGSVYNKFSDKLSSLQAASMDFWSPYKSATEKHFPQVSIVHDKFHLSRIFNRHIEQERRDYQRDLPDAERKEIKKHTRWILLRRRSRNEESYQEHFKKLKERNSHLFEMYLLKEDFLVIFDKKLKKSKAKTAILDWIEKAKESVYENIKSFAKKTEKRLETLLNWFDHPISNGLSEGINNVIKSLLKRGYGYKDFEYFRMKVLQKCGYLNNSITHTN